MRYGSIVLLAGLVSCQGLQDLRSSGRTPLHFEIGVVHRTVTTDSEEAQLWFDRGMALTFGFNHAEAVRCFERAIEADPDCAMAYWGKANALGPNYNSPVVDADSSALAISALDRAAALLEGCAPVERALIRAQRTRFDLAAPVDRTALDRAYATAMRGVRDQYPDDADVNALLAEALMQLKPWQLWSPEGTPAPELPEIRGVLETALDRWPDHPALCHLYIHAMEAGPEVALALPAAERLERLTPGLGHLVHMPSHIYTWTGRYADVIRVNVEAVQIDDAFADYAGRDNFYTAYRVHNYHFVAYGAMWDGQRALALEYSRRLVNEIPDSLMADAPDLFDVFTATPYHVMVRFGLWEELLEEPEPKGDLHAARAVWRYARALALASLGRVEEAQREERAFHAAKEAVPATRLLFNNEVSRILGVAEKVLAGEIAYRQEDYDRAFTLLRQAAALDEELNYDEPWGWMEPARHALGALLTEQGQFREALEVYQADLKRYPENGWSLYGMAECLRGLGREAEAKEVEARFAKAWERADVEIPGSCFCKTMVSG